VDSGNGRNHLQHRECVYPSVSFWRVIGRGDLSAAEGWRDDFGDVDKLALTILSGKNIFTPPIA
jgi:hypothetical protein